MNLDSVGFVDPSVVSYSNISQISLFWMLASYCFFRIGEFLNRLQAL